MATRKLLFQNIAKTASITNKDTIPNWPTGHENATRGYRKNVYLKGRYDQTVGNAFGDTYSGTPACPYHMPRDPRRYNEPRLHVPRKNAGDLIEAKDINQLVDKIKLYNQVWEAEANNIYGYQAVTGRSNTPVSISNLKYINAQTPAGTTINQPDQTIQNFSGGSGNITLRKDPIIYCVKGISEDDVRTKLTNAYNQKQRTPSATGTLTFGGLSPYGFPEDLPTGYVASDTITTETIHGGFSTQHGVKFVQAYKDSEDYNLEYTSGPKKGQLVKDVNGTTINFHTGYPYVHSTIKTDGLDYVIEKINPKRDSKFYGFILYWVNPIQAQIPESETITEVRTENVVEGIGLYGTATNGWYSSPKTLNTAYPTYPSGGTTPACTYDIAKALSNIHKTISDEGDWVADNAAGFIRLVENLFIINGYSSMFPGGWGTNPGFDYFKSEFNKLPVKTLNIPKQKLVDGKAYRLLPSGAWQEQTFIYCISTISPARATSRNMNLDGDYPTDATPVCGLNFNVSCWHPLNKQLYNLSGSTFSEGGNISGWWLKWYNYDPSFLNDPLGHLESICGRATITNLTANNGFHFAQDRFLAGGMSSYVDENTNETIYYSLGAYFDENGNSYSDNEGNRFFRLAASFGQTKYWYATGEACSDGSAPDENGVCTITTSYTTNSSDMYISETTTTITIREEDFTYSKDSYYIGSGQNPIIKGVDYSNIRNIMNSYLSSILIMAQTGINNGTVDSVTIQDIGAFQVSQAQQSTVFNPDDPDTTFYGYHALANGVIKLDFYNTLVDAYKLMINSCLCNADCACNLVCACNINCGCNY